MVAVVTAEIDLPPADGAWKPALRRTAISAHQVLDRHGWASALMMSSGLTPERLAYMESILGCLRAGGFSPYETHLAYHALECHIVGFSLWVTGLNLPQDLNALVADVLAQVPAEQFPAFVEHLGEHIREPRDTDVGAFEYRAGAPARRLRAHARRAHADSVNHGRISGGLSRERVCGKTDKGQSMVSADPFPP